MKLVKKVDTEGIIDVEIDGRPLDFKVSREITGTTREQEQGIFSPAREENFTFGDYQNLIMFASHLSLCEPVDEIAEIIKERTEKVREWVQECKDTQGTVEILTDDNG